MEEQINNAVQLVAHLRAQGLKPSEAIEHARFRFGVDPKVLMRRVNGYVADPAATQAALAEARPYLTGEKFWEYDDAHELADVLRRLYTAITGETI